MCVSYVLFFVACNCHNHATDCVYNERIAQEKRSLDINGNYEGGGVCVNCKDNTEGINCERCKSGFYRPAGVPKTSRDACQGKYFRLKVPLTPQIFLANVNFLFLPITTANLSS